MLLSSVFCKPKKSILYKARQLISALNQNIGKISAIFRPNHELLTLMANFVNSFSNINGDPDADSICNAPILEDKRIDDEELMDTSVSSSWPKVDFLCFQEVWDRYFSAKLIHSLYPEFKHFVVDVAHQSWYSNVYWGSKYTLCFVPEPLCTDAQILKDG